MQGGTTFHFVTDGIHAALERAKEAAGGKDVRVGGGVSTMRQYLNAGLVDDMHFVISPALIGSGERLFQDLNLLELGYELKGHTPSAGATHIKIGKRIS
jgi:dihydrofolate reductase